jgi:hypothetical protein
MGFRLRFETLDRVNPETLSSESGLEDPALEGNHGRMGAVTRIHHADTAQSPKPQSHSWDLATSGL